MNLGKTAIVYIKDKEEIKLPTVISGVGAI
jgi:hypothetical protein